ncbi:MAG: thioredoxin domain-containing protein [Thermoanaerobaculia bacterium]
MNQHTNRLAGETSPYLLQHAHNPVDWYPWGEEAFARARSEDKPVFLSIGYSACHWCHVMERESFENEAIAQLLNRGFVSIKVDREERPAVDSIYMQAVQMMTGHGGWPMSVFLTPEGIPFFGGTYFPPEDRHGLPAFSRVLEQLELAWKERRAEVTSSAAEIHRAIREAVSISPSPSAVNAEGLDAAASQLASSYDDRFGGFGSAPKFPPSMSLEFLMQVAERTDDPGLRTVVTHTLEKMAHGGLCDQVGGGFHRYSTDARWLVPHFEKMLYDNALLARVYVRAWQWTHEPLFARTARETLTFVQRELTAPAGGFYSSLDADSEGVEGKFYVWSHAEVLEALGESDGKIFAELYDIGERGNWEGSNIPNVPRPPAEVAAELGIDETALTVIANRGRSELFGLREKRIRPGRDEKVLAGWNGWMLAAFAEAALAFDSEEYREIVRRNAAFLLDSMFHQERLLRSWKDGEAKIEGVLEDYAGVAWGLLHAFEATGERRFLDASRNLADQILARFANPGGGFFDTPSDGEQLMVRPRDGFDNATPSGSSLAIASLLRLAEWFDDAALRAAAHEAAGSTWPMASRYPSAFGFFLSECAERIVASPVEIAITGPQDDVDVRTLLQVVGDTYLPHRLLAWGQTDDSLPLLEGKALDRVAAWVCEGYRCQAPVTDPEELRALLED